MWVWQSIRPGITVLSFRSITWISAGIVMFGPTAVILSFSIRMNALFTTAPVLVSISRPALIATRFGCDFGSPVWAKAIDIANVNHMRTTKGTNHFFILVIS